MDLACDIIARFGQHEDLPGAFFIDWIGVASDEGRHFLSLSERLKTLGAAYGDLPAHDGLWEAAENTAHDLLARLAVVPLVLEARGLDATPPMIDKLRAVDDEESAAILDVIHKDEIGRIAAGQRWFAHLRKTTLRTGVNVPRFGTTLFQRRTEAALQQEKPQCGGLTFRFFYRFETVRLPRQRYAWSFATK